MPNKFLSLGSLSALACVVASGSPSPVRGADNNPSSNFGGNSGSALQMRQAPVPIVRKHSDPPQVSSPEPETTAGPAAPAVEPSGIDAGKATERGAVDSRAAKAAVEADGYKRVTIVGRRPNGVWRAKAYRGETEVEISIDGAGTVTTD
jgi:hypothetical protein